jgi:hypothetical protein
MIEISPKVILSCIGFSPVPSLLNVQVRTVHVRHVPSVGELCEFGRRTESSLAQVVSSGIAGHVNSANWICDSDNPACPALIEGLIRVVVGSKIRVVVIEGTIEDFGVDDAKNWK